MDYADALIGENRSLAAIVRAADPATEVPTCPGWTLRNLATHVGRGHRWAAKIVAERAQAPVDTRSVTAGKRPDEPDAAQEWLVASAQAVLDAVASTGPETPVWTFVGPRPAAWWIRRRLHEDTVHKADAAIAVGVPFELAPELAADGISEWLDLVAARDAELLAEGATLHLHATDEGLGAAGEWLVRGTGGTIRWEHGHGKADTAARGAAADLLQAMVRRIPAGDGRVEVLGDAAAWTTWLEPTPF